VVAGSKKFLDGAPRLSALCRDTPVDGKRGSGETKECFLAGSNLILASACLTFDRFNLGFVSPDSAPDFL
jgi:hypothetical protein